MKWSFAGIGVIVAGMIGLMLLILFGDITVSNEGDYYLLKEITESAMVDSIDVTYYRSTGSIKIVKEKFVENFTRRYSESTQYGSVDYKINFYQILESPPKVSVVIDNGIGIYSINNDATNYRVSNSINSIIEYNPYEYKTITYGSAVYSSGAVITNGKYDCRGEGVIINSQWVGAMRQPSSIPGYVACPVMIEYVGPMTTAKQFDYYAINFDNMYPNYERYHPNAKSNSWYNVHGVPEYEYLGMITHIDYFKITKEMNDMFGKMEYKMSYKLNFVCSKMHKASTIACPECVVGSIYSITYKYMPKCDDSITIKTNYAG